MASANGLQPATVFNIDKQELQRLSGLSASLEQTEARNQEEVAELQRILRLNDAANRAALEGLRALLVDRDEV